MTTTPPSGPGDRGPAPAAAYSGVADGGDGGRDDTKIWLLRVAKGVVLFIYAVVIVNLVLLLLGFLLQLFGASTDAEFTRWVYRNVERIMDPFRGMFPSHQVSENSVLDVSLLFAMVVYAIVGIALHALVSWLAGKVVDLQRQQLRQARAAAQPLPPSPAAPGRYQADPPPQTYRVT